MQDGLDVFPGSDLWRRRLEQVAFVGDLLVLENRRRIKDRNLRFLLSGGLDRFCRSLFGRGRFGHFLGGLLGNLAGVEEGDGVTVARDAAGGLDVLVAVEVAFEVLGIMIVVLMRESRIRFMDVEGLAAFGPDAGFGALLASHHTGLHRPNSGLPSGAAAGSVLEFSGDGSVTDSDLVRCEMEAGRLLRGCLDLRHLEALALKAGSWLDIRVAVQVALGLLARRLREIKGRAASGLLASGEALLGGPVALVLGPVGVVVRPVVAPAHSFTQVDGVGQASQASSCSSCLGRGLLDSCHLEAGALDSSGSLDVGVAEEEALDRFAGLAGVRRLEGRAAETIFSFGYLLGLILVISKTLVRRLFLSASQSFLRPESGCVVVTMSDNY